MKRFNFSMMSEPLFWLCLLIYLWLANNIAALGGHFVHLCGRCYFHTNGNSSLIIFQASMDFTKTFYSTLMQHLMMLQYTRILHRRRICTIFVWPRNEGKAKKYLSLSCITKSLHCNKRLRHKTHFDHYFTFTDEGKWKHMGLDLNPDLFSKHGQARAKFIKVFYTPATKYPSVYTRIGKTSHIYVAGA